MRKTLIALALGLTMTQLVTAAPPQRFNVQLSGGDANGNVIDTRATGQASFEVLDDGTRG